MKFSIAVDMTRRRADVPMQRVAAEALEMVVAAEELGAVAALSERSLEVGPRAVLTPWPSWIVAEPSSLRKHES